ncbi:MAG: hypothetical protein ACP5SH_19715 [Syntrophobacteraceae bacterium]
MKSIRRGVFLLIATFLALHLAGTPVSANVPGIGIAPYGVAYDGTNIWVANYSRDTVTKLRAGDGSLVGTYKVPGPWGMAFDGENIWVASYSGGTVTKLKAANGALLGVYAVGVNPRAVLCDGRYIWVASGGDRGTVSKLREDGTMLWTTPMEDPWGMAFDGSTVWVTNRSTNRVTRLNESGCIVGVYKAGDQPLAIAFDGAYMWVADNGDDTVTKLSAVDGERVGKFPVGIDSFGIFSDGHYVWIVRANGVLTQITTQGCLIANFDAGDAPDGIAFDGVNIWVANTEGNVRVFRAYTNSLVATCNVEQPCRPGTELAR